MIRNRGKEIQKEKRLNTKKEKKAREKTSNFFQYR